MASRYDNKEAVKNDSEKYKEVFEDRGVKFIKHFETPKLSHATAEEIRQLDKRYHTWKLGDRFYKLAKEFYGDEKYWWIIAWYNQAPTESHVDAGRVLTIPLPLESLLDILRVT